MPWGDLPRGEFPGSGLLVVDKDAGVTSHDVVAAVRRLAGTRKAGHAGTLDPMATGVLCVGVGRATKLLRYVTGADKEYTATVRLGVETSTEDADGRVTAARGAAGLRVEAVDRAIAALTGVVEQVPSSVSAVKVGGRRAHELVRRGVDVRLPARPVRISAFEREGGLAVSRAGGDAGPVTVADVRVRVVCGAGTYVRALARDLGAALGTGAHLTALRRTRVGMWTESRATTIAGVARLLLAGGGVPLAPLAEVCAALFPRVDVSDDEAEDLASGRFIAMREWGQAPPGSGEEPVAAAWGSRGPVALVCERGGRLKPDLLLALGEDAP